MYLSIRPTSGRADVVLENPRSTMVGECPHTLEMPPVTNKYDFRSLAGVLLVDDNVHTRFYIGSGHIGAAYSQMSQVASAWKEQLENLPKCEADPNLMQSGWYAIIPNVYSDEGIRYYLADALIKGLLIQAFHHWERLLKNVASVSACEYLGMDRLYRFDEATIKELFIVLEALGMPVRSIKSFSLVEECRLLVNVLKHGHGKSAQKLYNQEPVYFFGETYALSPALREALQKAVLTRGKDENAKGLAKSLLNNPSHHLKRADPETVKVTVDKAKLLIDALSAFFLEMFLIAEAGETAQIIEMEAGPEAAQEYLKRTIMRDHPGNDVKGE